MDAKFGAETKRLMRMLIQSMVPIGTPDNMIDYYCTGVNQILKTVCSKAFETGFNMSEDIRDQIPEELKKQVIQEMGKEIANKMLGE